VRYDVAQLAFARAKLLERLPTARWVSSSSINCASFVLYCATNAELLHQQNICIISFKKGIFALEIV
jgi:hypothetical protein